MWKVANGTEMVFTVLDFGSMTPESREWMLVTMLVSMPGLPAGGMGGWRGRVAHGWGKLDPKSWECSQQAMTHSKGTVRWWQLAMKGHIGQK